MNINEIRVADCAIMVEFEDIGQIIKIWSGDTPSNDLAAAGQKLTLKAMEYFGIVGMPCYLRSVAVSRGQDPGSRIMLRVSTTEGEDAKLQLPKVTAAKVRDEETWQEISCPKNDYLNALEEFIAEAEQFVTGKRMQLSLPFQSIEDTEADESVAESNKLLDFAMVSGK